MARVLVVDDHLDAARMCQMLFESEGHQTRIAADGQAALELFESFKPDFVFLDIALPGMDGYELARTMRDRQQERRPNITALTGWGDLAAARLREAGIDSYFVKPVSIAVLREVLADQDKSYTV